MEFFVLCWFSNFLSLPACPSARPPAHSRACVRVSLPSSDRVRVTVLDFHVHASQLGVDDGGGGLLEEPADDRSGNVRRRLRLRVWAAQLRGSCNQHGGVLSLLVGQGLEPMRPMGAVGAQGVFCALPNVSVVW